MKNENGFEFLELSNLIKEKRIYIVASKWNNAIVSEMVNESLSFMNDLGIKNIEVIRVPGAWEIPYASLKAIDNGANGIITFGAIVKGETPHFEIISNTSSQAIMNLSLNRGVPIANGILATNNLDQAIERSSVHKLNKGREVTQSLLEMLEI